MRYDSAAKTQTPQDTSRNELSPMWLPSPMARLASQYGQAADIRASMNPGWQESAQTRVEGTIVGHASPQWRHPKGRQPAALNDALSETRAQAVHDVLAEMLRETLGAQASIAVIASGVEAQGDGAESEAAETSGQTPGLSEVHSGGVGDQAARGAPEANAPEQRRVDVDLMVSHDFEGEAGLDEALAERYVQPGYCQSHASQTWAVKLSVMGGAGHAGVGAAFAIGQLKNLTTGEVETGSFVGGGVGAGLQSPGADPGWGDWTPFQTAKPVTFADFQSTRARLTSAGAGVAIGGYALTWLSFPILGAQSIALHGPNMGALGADVSTNVGVWTLDSVPPAEHCVPDRERTAEAMQTVPVPYTHSSSEAHRLSVYFATGSARISDEAMEQLRALAAEIAASWQGAR